MTASAAEPQVQQPATAPATPKVTPANKNKKGAKRKNATTVSPSATEPRDGAGESGSPAGESSEQSPEKGTAGHLHESPLLGSAALSGAARTTSSPSMQQEPAKTTSLPPFDGQAALTFAKDVCLNAASGAHYLAISFVRQNRKTLFFKDAILRHNASGGSAVSTTATTSTSTNYAGSSPADGTDELSAGSPSAKHINSLWHDVSWFRVFLNVVFYMKDMQLVRTFLPLFALSLWGLFSSLVGEEISLSVGRLLFVTKLGVVFYYFVKLHFAIARKMSDGEMDQIITIEKKEMNAETWKMDTMEEPITIGEYDKEKLQDIVKKVVFQSAMAMFVHWKWGMTAPLMFAIFATYTVMYNSPLRKIHLLNQDQSDNPQLKRPWVNQPGMGDPMAMMEWWQDKLVVCTACSSCRSLSAAVAVISFENCRPGRPGIKSTFSIITKIPKQSNELYMAKQGVQVGGGTGKKQPTSKSLRAKEKAADKERKKQM
ncbi:unnamed protein product [Amoebophrya sp. A120]|nr:unnamed protein product [Amoebophrya sp. A120]|eukprot:GSA120T00005930001.1